MKEKELTDIYYKYNIQMGISLESFIIMFKEIKTLQTSKDEK